MLNEADENSRSKFPHLMKLHINKSRITLIIYNYIFLKIIHRLCDYRLTSMLCLLVLIDPNNPPIISTRPESSPLAYMDTVYRKTQNE